MKKTMTILSKKSKPKSINARYFVGILLMSFIALSSLQAQRNSIDSAGKRPMLPDSTIERKLVDLAMKSPAYETSDHQNKINEYQLKGAKNAWLNLLSISANYNDQTFAKNTAQSQYVYPKYFTGVTIPLGIIFSRTSIKAAKEQVLVGKDNQEELARSIKADILTKYKQFKTTGELIIHQRQVADDYQAALLQDEKKFSDGSITIELYNTASKNYNDELAKLLNLQLQQDMIRLDIERIIGTDLESVIH